MDAAERRSFDWESTEALPEFRDLVARRRRFVVPATIFFLAWYFGFIILAGYAPDFMGESVYQGLTVGYCLALTQFLMVAVLGLWYLRYAERELDPLRARIVASVGDGGGAGVERTELRTGAFHTEPRPRGGRVPR